MSESIRGKRVKKSILVPAEYVIREPDLRVETKAYAVGRQEYDILIQQHWGNWLSPLAFASLGVFLAQAYNLFAYWYQIYTHFEDENAIAQLKESFENDRTIIILIISACCFVVLLIVNGVWNYFRPTMKKNLLKKIRNVLDENPTVTARTTEREDS